MTPRANDRMSRHRLSAAVAGPTASQAAVGGPEPRKWQRLLYLHGDQNAGPHSLPAANEAAALAAVGHFAVTTLDCGASRENAGNASCDKVRDVWRTLLRDYEPHCLGLFGASASGASAVSRILLGGPDRLPAPGAIVVRRLCPDLIQAYLEGCEQTFEPSAPSRTEHPSRDAAARPPIRWPRAIEDEWPPILIVASAGDAHLGHTARTCRLLRQAGAPVQMDIFEDDPADPGAANDTFSCAKEQAYEITSFLDRHLGVGFPRLP